MKIRMDALLAAIDALRRAEQLTTRSTPAEIGVLTAKAYSARIALEVQLGHEATVEVDA